MGKPTLVGPSGRLVVALVLAAAGIVAAAAAPPPARSTVCVQSSDHRWRYFGKAPFASSREEGMANREAALRCLGLPGAVIAALMEATKHPAVQVIHEAKGDRVVAMASRPTTGPHAGDILVERRVLVDFIPTGTRGIGFYAKVEVWSVSVNGTVYTIGLPEVCNNWQIVSIKPEARPKEVARVVPEMLPKCPRIQVFVRPGDGAIEFIQLTPSGRVPASAQCPFLFRMPGDTHWYELPTECPHGPCDFTNTVSASGLSAGPSGGINVRGHPGAYEFQVSPEWASNPNGIYAFCLHMQSGEDSCAKDIRAADYTNSLAIVGYGDAGEVPRDWRGHERIWCKPSMVNGQCAFCPH